MHPDGFRILNASLCAGRVLLTFDLGVAESITLQCRRQVEREFLLLAEDDPSPVVDDRPKLAPSLPELRIYRAVLHYDGGETRRFSNEVRIVLP